MLRGHQDRIDLVISDIRRAVGPTGLDLVTEIGALVHHPAIILYVGQLAPEKGIPAGALGITNRPDQLLNLVMDGLDRLPDRKASQTS